MNWTYEPSPLFEICGQLTTHLSRVLMDIHVLLLDKVLDFIGSWFQLSVPEDG